MEILELDADGGCAPMTLGGPKPGEDERGRREKPKLAPFSIAEVFLLYKELTMDQRLFVLQKGARGPSVDAGALARNKLLLTVAAMAETPRGEIDEIDKGGRRRRIAASARTMAMTLVGTGGADGPIADVTPVTVQAVEILLSLVPDDLNLTPRRFDRDE